MFIVAPLCVGGGRPIFAAWEDDESVTASDLWWYLSTHAPDEDDRALGDWSFLRAKGAKSGGQDGAASPSVQDDATLLADLRAGDTAAFERLFRAFHPSLCDFTQALVHDADVARDVVSEVLTRFWDQRATVIIRGSVRGYLFASVRNRALNVLRDTRRRAESMAREVAAQQAHVDIDFSEVDDGGEGDDPVDTVWAAVARLPERARMVIVLRWRDGLSVQEIAEAMGVTPMAVHVLHSRALAGVRKQLPQLLR